MGKWQSDGIGQRVKGLFFLQDSEHRWGDPGRLRRSEVEAERQHPRGPWNQRRACLQEQAACAWWLIPQDTASFWPAATQGAAAGHCSTPWGTVTSSPLHWSPGSVATHESHVWLCVTKPFLPVGQLESKRDQGKPMKGCGNSKLLHKTFSKCVWAGLL